LNATMSAVADKTDEDEGCIAYASVTLLRRLLFHVEQQEGRCGKRTAFHVLMRCAEHGRKRWPLCRGHYRDLTSGNTHPVCTVCGERARWRVL
jgi:tRNA U34 5-methylaminomethyl-2-thiouridine-forming methyltransferase MnmC